MIAAADDDPTSSNSFRGVRFSARRGSNLRFASVLPIVVLAVVPLSCSSAPGPQRMRHPDTGAKSIRNQKGIEMVWIPPGTFTMGSTDAEIQAAYEDSKRASPQFATLDWFTGEKPRHRVTIPNGFYMGKYEVTQGQCQAVMGTTTRTMTRAVSGPRPRGPEVFTRTRGGCTTCMATCTNGARIGITTVITERRLTGARG